MLFPFHTKLSSGALHPKQFVETLCDQGVTAIEPMWNWIESDPDKWADLDQAAREAGLIYSCCDLGVNLVGEDEEEQLEALDKVERCSAFCEKNHHCSLELVFGSKPATGMSNEEGRIQYGKALARTYERVHGLGITPIIENFGALPTFAASGEHCMEVLHASNSPGVKFAFDNGNFLLGDDTPLHAYSLLKNHTVHVHIKDFVTAHPTNPRSTPSSSGKPYTYCPIGAGEAQVSEILQTLKADGHKGWISLEVDGSVDPLAGSIQGATTVKKIWAE